MAVVQERHAIADALGQLRDGVPVALDRVIPLVYGTLAGIPIPSAVDDDA